jgi:HK97 family phage prohead protease
MKEYNVKDSLNGASIKDIDGKKGIITGYFSKFNNVDSDGDIIRRGAFAKTIQETGPNSSQPRIKHLMNHNPSQPLGLLKSLVEDDNGLLYESQIGTHQLGNDFVKMVESGLITEHSIGFRITKRNQLQDYEGYKQNPNGGWYEITEVKLWEGSSLTAWGANSLTPITGLKSIEAANLFSERQKAIEKFCRNTDASDECIEMLLLHSKQLTQMVIDAKNTQPIVITEPNNSKSIIEAIKTFKNTLNQ